MDRIDWSVAQRIGELVAGAPPSDGVIADTVKPLAEDFARRVSDYSGLSIHGQLPPLEMVDRSDWIAANLQTSRPVMERVAARIPARSLPPGKIPQGWSLGLPDAMKALSGVLLGAQIGTVTGLLSQRVLGQYELSLFEPSATPRLLLVAPNLAQHAASMRVERDELLSWVTIHEITHAVQFSGAPWLRDYMAGMLTELLDAMEVQFSPRAALRLLGPDSLRELAERVRRGELLRLAVGKSRWSLLERIQATMSLIEGHAEHVMDAVGADVLPSLPQLRAAMTRRRREGVSLPWRVLSRLLGFEMKMRQYEVGRRFCDAVVAAGGPQALTRAWESPQAVPTAAELQAPEDWLARVA